MEKGAASEESFASSLLLNYQRVMNKATLSVLPLPNGELVTERRTIARIHSIQADINNTREKKKKHAWKLERLYGERIQLTVHPSQSNATKQATRLTKP